MNKRNYLTITQYLGNTENTFNNSSFSIYKNIETNKEVEKKDIKINNTTYNIPPSKWGPGLWYVLHTGSLNYPENPTLIYKDRMKNFIKGIPYILPCDDCRTHAMNFITENEDKLDEICTSKQNLFKFFVDFHNKVNKRHDKKIYTYEEALKLYTE